MGHMKNSYLKYDKTGNQYVGIPITGLLVLRNDFTFYTAYFDTENKEYGTAK